MFGVGASKGFMIIGAMKYLADANLISEITVYGGVSIGALFAYGFCLGFTPDELEEFCIHLDMSRLDQTNDLVYFIENFGFNDGTATEMVLRHLLEQKVGKRDISFRELHEHTGKTLLVQAANLSKHTLETFSHVHTPDMSVLTAIRMSISIPIVFTPVNFQGNLYIDPGVMITVPVVDHETMRLLDLTLSSILFIRLVKVPGTEETTSRIQNVADYLLDLLELYYTTKFENDALMNVISLKSTSSCVFPGKEQTVCLIKSGYEQAAEQLGQNDLVEDKVTIDPVL